VFEQVWAMILICFLRQTGSRVLWRLVGDHAELVVAAQPVAEPGGGFGLLRSRRKSVPADFDVASRSRVSMTAASHDAARRSI